MKTDDLKRQKTSYYRWQKLRLEALLAVVQRKDEFINVMRKARRAEDAIESVTTLFNLSSRQAYYLLGLELRQWGALEHKELQKEYEKVLRYYQIVAPNNKKL